MAVSSPSRVRNFPKTWKVLLIEPPNNLYVGFNATVIVEPLGLQYLAGGIMDLVDVMILDMRVDDTPLRQVIEEFAPDLVGIKEGYTVDVDSVKEVASWVKDIDPGVPVVVGGHHVSLVPRDAYSPHVDAIVIGDGEATFRQIVLNLQHGEGLDGVPDVIFQDAEGNFDTSNLLKVKKSSLKELDSPMMNGRPFPARHLVDRYREHYFFLYHTNPYSVETARGCQYRCNFCSVHEFHRGEFKVQGNDRTIQELSQLPKNSWVNIVDDLAIPEPSGAMKLENASGYDPMEELADRLIELDLGQRYWMQVRADNVVRNPRKFEKWARAGLDTTLVGLESFEQDALNSVSKGTKCWGQRESHRYSAQRRRSHLGRCNYLSRVGQKRTSITSKKRCISPRSNFPNYTILTPLPGTKQWRDVQDNLVTREPRFFDFLHSVLPTNLNHNKFYEQYASLWRFVGDGGFDRVRKMLQEVSTTRESIMRFLRQYKTLSDVSTYDSGIEILEKANAGVRAEAQSNA